MSFVNINYFYFVKYCKIAFVSTFGRNEQVNIREIIIVSAPPVNDRYVILTNRNDTSCHSLV